MQISSCITSSAHYGCTSTNRVTQIHYDGRCYRAQRRTDLLPQVHQSAGKGGISMVILACLLIWHVGLSSISRSGIQASEVVCPLRYCLGPIESFVGFYLLSYPQSYTLPHSSTAGTLKLSSGLCRQSWILSKHSQLRMHRLRST